MNPDRISTLIELLAFRAGDTGDKLAFTYNGRPNSYAQVWDRLNHFASALVESGLQPGDCAIVAVPNSPEFFDAFYGIQRAGGIAVPVYPESGTERILSLAGICSARIIVLPPGLPVDRLTSFRNAASSLGINIITGDEAKKSSRRHMYPEIHPEDIAFLQFTSGSTGNPKGVTLTHDNLLTNIRQMIEGMEITENDIFVSWLPVYHDMGLILKTMVPFYLAVDAHLLPTNLRDVRPWLEAIQNYQATFTAAPDFAYRLVVRHTLPDAFDLSSLRVALNAAEPVRPSTMREFEHHFGLKNVMVAGYGLAEATVGVSMSKPKSQALIDDHGRVSVGKPFPDVEVQILDEEDIAAPGIIGEIIIRSKANSRGYFRNAQETARLFWKDGFLKTGDLGYLDENKNLFIVSRKKNLIKRLGESIAPQEIEELIDSTPGVRFSAAVGIDKGGAEGEQVFVFAEIRNEKLLTDQALYDLAFQIIERFYEHMGYRIARIYLLKPRSIPVTHNGKIQYGRLKEMYLDGSLRKMGMILFPDF